METLDVTHLSLNELKVLAYDTLASLEQAQRNLQIINEAIARKAQRPTELIVEQKVDQSPADDK